MNNIFNPGNYQKNIDLSLLILRLVAGAFMLTHGMGKLFMLMGSEPIQFPDPIGVGASTSLFLAVFAEVVCAVLIIVGFASRFAAIPLIITMLVAGFVVHASDGFSRQELPFMYAAMYLVIAIAGAGKYSIDSLIYNKVNLRQESTSTKLSQS